MTTREYRLRLRAQEAPKRASRKKVWEAPAPDSFASGLTVLAFDQSLMNTGWVHMEIDPRLGTPVIVHDRGTLRCPFSGGGHGGTIVKGNWLTAALTAHAVLSVVQPDVVVAEATPIMGWRLESSLLSAFVVQQVYPTTELVNRQAALALLLPPDKRYEKKHSIEVKDRYVSMLDGKAPGRWNEHERDALMLGLTRLHQIAQEGP